MNLCNIKIKKSKKDLTIQRKGEKLDKKLLMKL